MLSDIINIIIDICDIVDIAILFLKSDMNMLVIVDITILIRDTYIISMLVDIGCVIIMITPLQTSVEE
jgi:hypothetical protein